MEGKGDFAKAAKEGRTTEKGGMNMDNRGIVKMQQGRQRKAAGQKLVMELEGKDLCFSKTFHATRR